MKWDNIGKWPGLPNERFWTPGKLTSGGIVVTYIVIALAVDGPASAFEIALSAAVPILCIWVPEITGAYEGWGSPFGRPITRQSPASFVRALGWLTLLLPVIQVGIIVWGLR